MFVQTKTAVINKATAIKSYSPSEMTHLEKTRSINANQFGWSFDITVLGCGTTVQLNDKGETSSTQSCTDEYTLDQYCDDLRKTIKAGTTTLKQEVNARNGGLDLDLRNSAITDKPASKGGKMTDDKKAGWVIANDKMGKAKTMAQFVAIYNKAHKSG
jgi:hypothetical protein